MFEGIVAHALNKYLGRYVEDLDSEQLNVGIFSGTVHLTDLRLKPEALAGLDLPIEVKGGSIGKISIDIPWTSLYYDPVLVHVEEVLVLSGPIADRKHDPERDKRLSRAFKNRRLERAQPPDVPGDRPKGFMENLITIIVNNVQVSVQNVHVRYEDGFSTGGPLACGLALQSLTAVTTSSKWKACHIDADASTLFKLLKVESLSVYWNAKCPTNTLLKAQLHTDGWKTLLRKGLATFSINGEDFDFIIKPMSLKAKMILNKSREAKVPRLLLDFVLQDAASQLSREQFISMYELSQSFKLMSMNQRFSKYFSSMSAKGHATDFWRDSYKAVLEEYIRPYTWSRIKEHRNKYRKYKSMYKDHLHRPTDTELKLDLQMLEDSLDVTSILIAREQAKIEIARDEPDLVRSVRVSQGWTLWNWFSSSRDETDAPESPEELLVVGDRDRNWWTKMTAEEKRRLFEGIGYDRWGPAPEEPLSHIGHKINFTLANCTLSLVNNSREILVATVTHFLSSLETRPGAKAYKISARTESLVIEAISSQSELVPVITADSVTSGSDVSHVFALDFEKNPMHVNAKYGLIISVEPMEVIYQKHAVKELINFFELPQVSVELLKQRTKQKLKLFAEISKKRIHNAFQKHEMVHLNVDLRSPYFIIPEHGSWHKGGSVIILDTGHLAINTELQSDLLVTEESTRMEVEERLYDRFNIALSDIQVLFSDSGDEWRVAKMASESEYHLIPKAKVLVVFSNSVRPDCKTIPRKKLNISVPSLKLNLSDRRVSMILEFLQNIPLPKTESTSSSISILACNYHLCSHSLRELTKKDLREVWKSLHRKQKPLMQKLDKTEKKAALMSALSGSDMSDEEEIGGTAERWARLIDLPGFEDNVSASNYIQVLFRFVAGEVAIHLARSSDHADKPYLMLRAEKLCVDAAHLQYGPAIQASLHRIQLVDKLHKGSSGEYLDLISSDNATDMINILYRKVQANCPEFKSHFHQVEHSLVMDLSSLIVAFHREAFATLGGFLQYIAAKLKPKSLGLTTASFPCASDLVLADSLDPPIPPGATKFSISSRLNSLKVRLCDTDLDLANFKVMGLEVDYVLKANEKSVMRVNLTEISMEDLMEDTLYEKILATEGEKVFDIKWVHHSPHHRGMITDGAKKQDALPVLVDGSLRVRFGRCVIVLLHSFANELQRFMEPFLNPDMMAFVKRSMEEKLQQKVCEFQQSGLRYQVSVEIMAPTLVVPQKATSPNALLLQLGELSAENFFQEDEDSCTDHLLIRLHSLQMARAVILLDGQMEVWDPIVEPLKLRIDIKRALTPFKKEGLLYHINGSMDLIKVHVGQRDLSTMISVYQDNYNQFLFFDSSKAMAVTPENENEPEESVRKLEVFLYASSDVRKESSVTFIMEGLTFTLYSDGDDLHSSRTHKPEQALTTFQMDEASLNIERTTDKAMEVKLTCQAATLVDVTAPPSSSLRLIFQSYSGDIGSTGVAGISLSMPPMVDLTFRKSACGDAAVDAVVEKIRLNVSVSYLLGLMKFVLDALPGSRLPSSSAFLEGNELRHRLPSDCTSGYQSTVSIEEHKALSLSITFRKPELVLYSEPDQSDTGVLLLKMDVMLDYSFNLGVGKWMLSVAGLHALSCIRKHSICTVIHPCDFELERSLNLAEEEVKVLVSMSRVQLCLSAPVVKTILQVTQQLLSSLQEEEDRKNYKLEKEAKAMSDLWSPSAIAPHRYSQQDYGFNCPKGRFLLPKYSENMLVNIPEVLVWYELKGISKNIPVLYAKGAFEAEIKDWTSQMSCSGELRLELMCYNEKVASWEPLLEQVLVQEGQYRPLDIMFKLFRDSAHPMVRSGTDEVDGKVRPLIAAESVHSMRYSSSSSSSGNETESDDLVTTTVIRRKMQVRPKRLSSIAKLRDSASFVACDGDSDSENEDRILEKIASTFDHLFSEDEEEGSDGLASDSEGIADVDDEAPSDSGETEMADNEDVFDDAAPVYASPHNHYENKSVDPVADTALYLTIDCRDTININVTPASVSVMQDVIKEFTLPVFSPPRSQDLTKELLLRNCLGPEASVTILRKDNSGSFELKEEACGKVKKAVIADPDLITPLVDISPAESDSEMAGDDNDGFHMSSKAIDSSLLAIPDNLYPEKSIAQLYDESTQEKLIIKVEGFDKLACHLLQQTSIAMYALQPVKNQTRYFVFVSSEISRGQRIVTVQSSLKIQNHMDQSVHLLCEKSSLEMVGALPEDYSSNPFQGKYVRLACLAPDETYQVPLLVAYHCKLYIRPLFTKKDSKEYSLSTEGIWWKDMTAPQRSSKFLQCHVGNGSEAVTCTKVVCVENYELKTPSVGTKLVPNYFLHLYPPLVFHNFLPLSLDLRINSQDKTIHLSEGESAILYEFSEPQEILLEVGQYVGLQWHGKLTISAETEELHPLSMVPETDTGGGNRHLSLNVHIQQEKSLDVYFFAPYWIINKTGLPLQLKGSQSDAVYETSLGSDPLLFRFKKHRKKKAKLRVYSSQWSKSFSLDSVGNCGVVICTDKERKKKYHFFVDVKMSKEALTKVILIKPFFLVINNTENHLRFMEKNENTDLWFDIAPDQCLPFWPDTGSMKIFVKLRDSKTVSHHFPIDLSHVTVFRMEHGSALKVEVKRGEDVPTTIAFQPFMHGDAPVRVDNCCEDLFLKIHQKSQSQVTLLNPYQSVLYTWDDPSAERTLVWNLYNRKRSGFKANIHRDGYGCEKVSFHTLRKTLVQQPSLRTSSVEESSSSEDDSESEDGSVLPRKTRKDKVVVHWVSYMERSQRVLLFTQDERTARQFRKAVDGEKAHLECFLSLHSVGVSIINSAQREVAFASFTSCPAIWEIEINRTWKLLTLELSAWLEDKWAANQQKAQLKDYLQVDLSKMQMIKPFFGQLRRFCSPAFWCQLRRSPYQTYVHLKIHRFQVDNQLPDSVFPLVLYPGITPQYVVKRSGPKPFLETALLWHNSTANRTLKFWKLLVQEIHVSLDKGFLLSLYDIFSNFSEVPDKANGIKEDLKLAQGPLYDYMLSHRPSRKRISTEFVHLSPILLYFSFSPRGTVYRSNSQAPSSQGDIMDQTLNSIGATLSEVKNVEIRVAFYEKRGFIGSPKELIRDACSHYKSQLVQQVYVLVLGLDILGNPFGLLKDFTRGLGDFFYEPYLGSIRGPDEFAESLARGAQSLLGHVIGGSAGTGSLGQTLGLSTFDEDYRKKRQQRAQLENGSIPETLLSASRSFVLGVGLGLSGVVVHPATDRQLDGVEGFFRGIGKGLLGLITKPAGGVLDMVSMAFDGIRRAAEMGENVIIRIRLPRYLRLTEGLHPYSPYLAAGCHLLEQVSKGHYADTDVYWAHAALALNDRPSVALITNNHIFLLEKVRFWGGWSIEWMINVDDVLTVPHIQSNNLVIKVKQEDCILNFTGDERFIQCEDPIVLEWLKDKTEKVLVNKMREKPCA